MLNLRVWQSLPWDQLDELRKSASRSGLGDDLLRVGYIKAFLDGTLGSRTALLLDGSGIEIVGYEEFDDVVRRSAARGLPGRRPCDRRPRQPAGPRRLRGDPGRVATARPPSADRACPAPRRGGRRSLRGARGRRLGPVQPRAVRPRSRRRVLGREDRRGVRVPLARRLRARSSPTAPMRPSRSSTRSSGSGPASPGRSTIARPGTRSRP